MYLMDGYGFWRAHEIELEEREKNPCEYCVGRHCDYCDHNERNCDPVYGD